MDKIKPIIDKQKGKLISKQHLLNKKFNLDCSTKLILEPDGTLFAYDKYKVLMKANYHVIGTLNEKTCFWRWAWGNPYLPCKLSDYSKKLIEYGEQKQIQNFSNPKIKGKTNAFKFLIIASLLDESIEGYFIYKKPRSNLTTDLLVYNTKKTNKKLTDLTT